MHTTIGLTAYRRGVIDSLRGWTTALEIAYRSGDVASVRTAQDALDRGVAAREIWQALCVDLQVPVERRHGRGLRDPRAE